MFDPEFIKRSVLSGKWFRMGFVLLVAWWVFHTGIGLLIPHFVDEADIQRQIIEGVKDETSLIMTIEGFKIQPTLLDGVQVQLHNITLKTNADENPVITGRDVGINVRYWPLLIHQQIEVSTLHLNHIQLPQGLQIVLDTVEKARQKEKQRLAKGGKPKAKEQLFKNTTIKANSVVAREATGLVWQLDHIKLAGLVSEHPLALKVEGRLNSQPNDKQKDVVQFRVVSEINQVEQLLRSASLTATAGQLFVDVQYNRQRDALKVITRPLDLALLSRLVHHISDTYNIPGNRDFSFSGTVAGEGRLRLEEGAHNGAGSFTLHNVALASKQGKAFEQLNGKLHLDGSFLRLARWRLLVDNNPFSIDGRLDLKEQDTKISLQGKNLNLNTLGNSLAQLTGTQYNLGGRADVDMLLSGALDKLKYAGNIQLHNVSYQDPVSKILLERTNGQIRLGEVISLQGVSAYVGQNRFEASGNVFSGGHYNINLHGPNVSLAAIKNDMLSKSPALQKQFKDIQQLSGQAVINLNIQQPAGKAGPPRLSGNILLQNLLLGHAAMAEPLQAKTMAIHMANNTVEIPATQARMGPVALSVAGKVGHQGTYRFSAKTGAIPMSHLREQQGFYEGLAKMPLPEIWNTAGSFALDANISNQDQSALLSFNNAGLSWQGGDFPLYDMTGDVKVSIAGERLLLKSDGLSARYGNSNANIVIDYDRRRTVSLNASGQLSPLTVNHFLTSHHATHAPYRHMPFEIQLAGEALPPKRGVNKGRPGGRMQAKARLDLADNTPDDETDQSNVYALLNIKGEQGTMTLDGSKLHLNEAGEILLSGKVKRLRFPEERSVDVSIKTPEPLHLAAMANLTGSGVSDYLQGASGVLGLDVHYQSTPDEEPPLIQGSVVLDKLAIPRLDVLNITGEVAVDENGARYDFPALEVPGVSISLDGESLDAIAYPVQIDNVNVAGTLFHVPSYQAFFREIVEGVIQPQIVQRLFRPWQEGDPIVPIAFRDADIAINEVIYENILLNNVTGKLSVFSNSFFELRDMHMEAAGGEASGYLSMNPADNNFTSLQLDTKGVKVNAVTRALLNTSNQIFGDLDGSIRFTTQGVSDDDMLRNANGIVRLTIEDGRLPAIAKIETLLTGANIIRGGILGLNLGNIVRTIAPFKTNYFAELSGDLLVLNKGIHTNNLLSDGENLDLLMQGSIAMDTGEADMWIHGKMSQDVSGRLGSLGKLSIGRLFRKIPLLGFIPGSKKSGVLYWIPGVGFTPGLGGAPEEFNHFQVHINGMLDDPAAVSAFNWVSTPAY